ncbi:MAG: hypothetical protein KDC26_11575 [Armatimonadetes bacterium]|nr:hypothetical protein [Armatimonadota bacterium]
MKLFKFFKLHLTKTGGGVIMLNMESKGSKKNPKLTLTIAFCALLVACGSGNQQTEAQTYCNWVAQQGSITYNQCMQDYALCDAGYNTEEEIIECMRDFNYPMPDPSEIPGSGN